MLQQLRSFLHTLGWATLFVLFCVTPAEAKIIVDFGTVLNASGDELKDIHTVRVTCNDGSSHDAGVCNGDTSGCVADAVALCGVTATAGSSGAPGRGTSGLSGLMGTTPGDFVVTSIALEPSFEPAPELRQTLAEHFNTAPTNLRRATLAKLGNGVIDIMGCDFWCIVWGPGCPCSQGDDNWPWETSSISSTVAEMGASLLFDLAECGLQLENSEEGLSTTASETRLTQCVARQLVDPDRISPPRTFDSTLNAVATARTSPRP